MALQRFIYQASKHCITRNILQSNCRQSYCQLRRNYSDSTRKYTDRHEWVVVQDKIGTVGISKYAQDSLGDVVFAQLPDVGTKLGIGDECGALESVKAASEIFSPVSGTVTEKNKNVESKPGLINSSCYEEGWLFKLELSKPDELKTLMTEKQYKEFLVKDAEKEAS